MLLVGQRITKYPLLLEPLLKTSPSTQEKEELMKALTCSKELNARVNERVAERERLNDICQRIDSKSGIVDGSKRIRRDDLLAVPSRRLLFHGQAIVNSNRTSGNVGAVGGGLCNVLILTDSLVFTQEMSGRLYFASPVLP